MARKLYAPNIIKYQHFSGQIASVSKERYLIHSMRGVKASCLLLNVTCMTVLSTAAERRIEELEKELLKVHQQMLDHLSDSQVIYITGY